MVNAYWLRLAKNPGMNPSDGGRNSSDLDQLIAAG